MLIRSTRWFDKYAFDHFDPLNTVSLFEMMRITKNRYEITKHQEPAHIPSRQKEFARDIWIMRFEAFCVPPFIDTATSEFMVKLCKIFDIRENVDFILPFLEPSLKSDKKKVATRLYTFD
ncbi:hypothetical protein Ciccas_013959 [Cichlidogyrus casuarinus]|uniref:Uncharacterized protein n=1 Tax=Cichlidogyrus casuarinus TaxID=1844966 RepID=A0ABD2PJZ5_9PLAT